MRLTFGGIPDADVAAFTEGVQMTLSQLNIKVDYDETSPPDKEGEVTYSVEVSSSSVLSNP